MGELVTIFEDDILPIIESEVVPAFEDFADWLKTDGIEAIRGFVGWMKDLKDQLPLIIGGVIGLTAVMIGLNIAMSANPVGAVITGIGALIGLIAFLVTNFNDVSKVIADFSKGASDVFFNVGRGIAGFFEGIVNTVIDATNTILRTIGELTGGNYRQGAHVDLTSWYNSTQAEMNNRLSIVSASGVNGLTVTGPAPVRSGVGGSVRNSQASNWTDFAVGGIVRATPGGIPARVAEAGVDEAVIPLTPENISKYFGGSGRPVVVEIHGNGMALEQIIEVKIRENDGSIEQVLTGGKVRN